MQRKPLIIIGAGPAGLSAAIYTARASIDTLVLGCKPKIAGDYDIDNYFGFPETISGKELLDRGLKQAERFGAKVMCDQVLGIHHGEDGGFVVKTEKSEYQACAVILATGVGRMKVKIPGLDAYEGKGVSYCVSCDGFFYKGRPVMVVGEGNYAANQALELTAYTADVSVCPQGKELTMNNDNRDLLAKADIPVIDKTITELSGDPALERIRFGDGSAMDMEGLFLAAGQASSLDFALTLGVERKGVFLKADDTKATNIPGVFAAGDCLGGFLQISVAVGEGALAAKSAISYIRKICPLAKKQH